jgi:hypothetical protein
MRQDLIDDFARWRNFLAGLHEAVCLVLIDSSKADIKSKLRGKEE